MVTTIQYKELNDGVVKAIKNRELDANRLQEVRQTVEEHHNFIKKRTTPIYITTIISYVVLLILSVLGPKMSGKSVDIMVTAIGLLVVYVFVFLCMHFTFGLTHGKMTKQYNRALKKGYPELYAQMKV